MMGLLQCVYLWGYILCGMQYSICVNHHNNAIEYFSADFIYGTWERHMLAWSGSGQHRTIRTFIMRAREYCNGYIYMMVSFPSRTHQSKNRHIVHCQT